MSINTDKLYQTLVRHDEFVPRRFIDKLGTFVVGANASSQRSKSAPLVVDFVGRS